MTNKKNVSPDKEHIVERVDEHNEEMSLDDARRVKVLSPGMLVLKRFFRNRLAIVGMVILVFMFLFSFLGPIFSPYTQTQVFTKTGSLAKEYAGAIYNLSLIHI